jgi:lysine 6-dehydrogenase
VRSFVVLGAGAIGRVIVRDLFESHSRNKILVADLDLASARRLAAGFRSKRVTAAFADASNLRHLSGVIRGHTVVINSTRHHLNLRVMAAALEARAHYVDLGGLFTWTRRQLRLHRQFQQRGVLAVPGMGCAPGLTNLLTMAAAERMDRVETVRIRVGSVDFNAATDAFSFPYSAETIVEELTLTPWKWSRGRFAEVPARSGWELVPFGPPVGDRWTVTTRHSEIATLPRALRDRGLSYADFKVSFDRAFVRELVRRLRNGWTVRELAKLTTTRSHADDYEIARVEVSGRADGSKLRCIAECHAEANAEWGASAGDIDTACPASIVAQMIASGEIDRRGVFAPEDVAPYNRVFDECRKRGMNFRFTYPQ